MNSADDAAMKNNKMSIDELKAAIAVARQTKFPKYPESVWRQATEYSDQHLGGGGRLQDVADQLGVKLHTLCYWREKRKSRVKKSAKSTVPVSVKQQTSVARPCQLVLRIRDGARIEGLTIQDVASLLKELS